MGKDKKHEAGEVVSGLDDFIKHINEYPSLGRLSLKGVNTAGDTDVEIIVRKHGVFLADEFDMEKLETIKALASDRLERDKSKIFKDIIAICNSKIDEYKDSQSIVEREYKHVVKLTILGKLIKLVKLANLTKFVVLVNEKSL